MRALAFFALATLSGCVPSLADGTYGCADGGGCPEGWVCGIDQRCHESGAATFTPCANGLQCESGFCARSPDASTDAAYCSTACSNNDDAQCAGLPEPASCWDDRCLKQCETAADCEGTGTGCHLAHIAMSMPPPRTGSCMALESDALSGRFSCTSPMMCMPPGFCIQSQLTTTGLCGMFCRLDEHCLDGGRCLEVLTGVRFCVRTCSAPEECVAPLVCRAFAGDATTFCMPSPWANQTLPLPGSIRPPP